MTYPVIQWSEGAEAHTARWHSESSTAAPQRVIVTDDRISADEAYGLACQGTALLWRGDFHNARQLLTAMANRAERPARAPRRTASVSRTPVELFHLHRQARSQRARTLGAVLVVLDKSYVVQARRAPDIRQACLEALGPAEEPSVISLRSLLGLIGAHEWRTKGIDVPALGDRIYPHFGVFAPIRSEYLDLVATAPLPSLMASRSLAFDIGTGTGVLAAMLARRGIERVIATDLDRRAVQCARDNLARLNLSDQVDVQEADLFPDGRAALVVCNPPWIPARPSSPLERGIYDPDSHMLNRFLSLLPEHLDGGGEGWLILSDLAEHLGLRTRADLLAAFDRAGLAVAGKLDTRPRHPKVTDDQDPLHLARAAEVTSLWRLRVHDPKQEGTS